MRNSITAIAALILLTVTVFSISSAAAESASDRNGDGKPDRWIENISGGGQVIRSDNNHDGVVDYILEIDSSGNKVFEQIDFNLDGKMDDFYHYQNGVLEHQEIDTNYDEKIDVWVYLDQGIYIIRVERDKDFDGVIDYTKKYR